MKLLVLGGGVAGLAMALAANRAGHQVVLAERDTDTPAGDAARCSRAGSGPAWPSSANPTTSLAWAGGCSATALPTSTGTGLGPERSRSSSPLPGWGRTRARG
jgi:glycine/D-amino acid oxidase-like deaminating enzyme